MKKILLIAFVSNSFAISLGDTFDKKSLIENSKHTQKIKLITRNSKSVNYEITSDSSKMNIFINNSTHKIFAITWDNKTSVDFKDILGNYYQEFQEARKNPKQHIPLRSIVIDDGDLSFSQYGSMITGFHGSTYVKSLAP
ncbi:MAG TPA: DUF2844 domain-containing protein [Burkholderiales bacterium]|nr:DUF2844 domain-containing protein [Burkholderiales bacterium]